MCVWNCRDQNDGRPSFEGVGKKKKKSMFMPLGVAATLFIKQANQDEQLLLSSAFQAHQRRMVRRVGPVTLITLYRLATGTEKSLGKEIRLMIWDAAYIHFFPNPKLSLPVL